MRLAPLALTGPNLAAKPTSGEALFVPSFGWNAPGVVGRLGELVTPTTYKFPLGSTATPKASEVLPTAPFGSPRSVEYKSVDKFGSKTDTKALPFCETVPAGMTAPGVVGKQA